MSVINGEDRPQRQLEVSADRSIGGEIALVAIADLPGQIIVPVDQRRRLEDALDTRAIIGVCGRARRSGTIRDRADDQREQATGGDRGAAKSARAAVAGNAGSHGCLHRALYPSRICHPQTSGPNTETRPPA
jgi:hypothetical protein